MIQNQNPTWAASPAPSRKRYGRRQTLDRLDSSELTQDILLALTAEFPHVRAWRNNTGAAQGGNGRVVRFGVKGQGDISGIIGPAGRRLEIEVKTGTGHQTRQQERFGAMVNALGGLYFVARSVDDVRRRLAGDHA